MFYSQIILAKKGPLGKVWMAAHWGDKKLGRPQIFATDISASVDSIVHPQVPLALRVSGHLLLGVVRIYSRKVKYLMHDCHEAMVKIKMAFRPSQEKNAAIDLPSNLKESSNMNVANFGEYHEVVFEITDAPTGFQLPFEINDDAAAEDWVPADLDETHEIVTGLQAELGEYGSPRDAAAAAVNNTLNDSELTDMLNRGQDEAWTAWNVDEEGEEVPFQDDSHVSDIEITRAANDSISSEAQIGRASILDKPVNSSLDSSKINLTAGGLTDQNEFPIADDTEMIPFDDEDDTRHDIRNASLNLSVSRDGSAGNATVAIGGLDDSQDSAVKGSVGNKRASVAPKRRTRKRRKVVVDNDDTELPNKHIKDMLADTSDIVLQNVVHPATWVPGQDKASHKRSARDLLFVHLSYEKILARPALGDDGQLAPELLALWAKNTAPVVGKPFPYELRVGANEEDESDEDESIEEPRRRQSHEADPDRLLETRQVQLQDMHESGSIVNDDEPTPWDDQDELPGPMDDSRDEEHLMNMSEYRSLLQYLTFRCRY
jgi:cohesin complex subunit SCC1